MEIEQTYLKGCFIVKSKTFKDERGSFMESFNEKSFLKKAGVEVNFVQDNQSVSKKGVLRGFHFQEETFAQAKLVRVIKGEVQDVVVDLRKDSKTFGKHFSIIINEENNYQLFVPKGFAHAFLSLKEDTIFAYKCDQYYNKKSESGIIFNDKNLAIDWKFPEEDIIISEKDLILPRFIELGF